MEEIKKINEETLENVTGGVRRVVYGDQTDYVNIRSGPGTGYKAVGKLYDGAVVNATQQVYNSEDKFYWTQLDSGCWVASHFLH